MGSYYFMASLNYFALFLFWNLLEAGYQKKEIIFIFNHEETKEEASSTRFESAFILQNLNQHSGRRRGGGSGPESANQALSGNPGE